MADVILNQSSAQVQAFLNRMSPLIGNGGKLSALGFAYAICSTPGDIATKQVSIPDFIRTEGAIVAILFTDAFTVSEPKLQIGSYAAADIKLYGSALAPGKVRTNTVVTMRFSGGVYNVIAIESQVGLSTHGAVDLALPSGVLWCEHNVGASRPEDAGLYFSWGNVTGHAKNSGYEFTKNNYDASAGAALTGDISVGDQYDMAHHNMGGQWRLPRRTEFQELYDNCTSQWIIQDEINGRRFTSNINGNSIFFPAAGYYTGTTLNNYDSGGFYWSSGFYSASHAYLLTFGSSGVSPQNDFSRLRGLMVRAVQ